MISLTFFREMPVQWRTQRRIDMKPKEIITLLIITILGTASALRDQRLKEKTPTEDNDRLAKLLPVFQIVRFPNDPCEVVGGSKNGTCYTSEECSNKGGTSGGTCASGFGVCCQFSVGCGSESSENCTYFESGTNVAAGACRAKICKCSNDICQFRLDFQSFVITGPSTLTTSIGKLLNGVLDGVANGNAVSEATQCLDDIFTVSNAPNLPYICGTNSGEHVYFDANDACHSLDFQFANSATGVSALATRTFSIKITQYSCFYDNLAPSGCDQYYFGSGATNYVQSFNYDGGRHLANQKQTICVRREQNFCKICWSADAKSDIQLTMKTTKKSGVVTGTICCAYGTDGKAISKGAYDCIMIPGATNAPSSMCGRSAGLVTKKGDNGNTTVCSKSMPFRIDFNSDAYETTEAMGESTGGQAGFKLRYFQTAC